jgi:hypothetical protein
MKVSFLHVKRVLYIYFFKIAVSYLYDHNITASTWTLLALETILGNFQCTRKPEPRRKPMLSKRVALPGPAALSHEETVGQGFEPRTSEVTGADLSTAPRGQPQ